MHGTTYYDHMIVTTVVQVTSKGNLPRVFPHDLYVVLPVAKCIREIRRDMARLAEWGYIERLGPRSGYRCGKAA